MEVTLVGMGGGLGCLTGEGRRALEEADCLLGAARLLELAQPLVPGLPCRPATRPEGLLEALQGGNWQRPCVLFSGDTGFYSGASGLAALLRSSGIPFRVVPGVSSPQLLAARLGEPWQDWQLVSAHGRDCDPVCELLSARGRDVCFLTGGSAGAGELCRRLVQAGLGGQQVVLAEGLAAPEERVLRTDAQTLAGQTTHPLSLLLCRGVSVKRRAVTPGIPDEDFLRGDAPMTKRWVRAAALSALEPEGDMVCWDVGAGTGSVAVELALLCPRGRVFAVEHSRARCELLGQNREKFGAWQLEVVEGSAPEALAALPAPDRVFLGGSGGGLEEILAAALEANPRCRVCITAVTVETLGRAVAALTRLGLSPQVSQLTAASAQQVGGSHLMRGENPVWIITAQGGEEHGV